MAIRNRKPNRNGLVKSAESKLRYENKELKERIEALEKQLSIHGVVSSFIYVLKAKNREEPLGIYKTYQKAYRSKTNFAKNKWTNTHIEKWNII